LAARTFAAFCGLNALRHPVLRTKLKIPFALPVAIAFAIAGCASGSAPTIAPAPAVALATSPQASEPIVLVPVPIVPDSPSVVKSEVDQPEPQPISQAIPEAGLTTPAAPPPSPAPTLPETQAPDELQVALAPVDQEQPVVTPEKDPAGPADVDAPSVAFLRPGETLVFRMSWGIMSNVGETRIETIEEKADDSRRFRIKISTKSRGLLNAIYPVVNDSESVIDRSTGRPLQITVEGKSGSRPTKTLTQFDYKSGKIVHTDFLRPDRTGTADLPPEPAYDLMVAMLQSREWNLQPGEKRDVLTAFEDEFYYITLTAHWRENVKTGAGNFDAVMIEPTQIGEQKGFFRRGGSMRYWISDGPKPQVVKMVFKTKAGTLTALLDE
jgi:hypothetical protein